jgi:hypothetical protein
MIAMFVTIRIYETPQPKHEIAEFVEERFLPSVSENSDFRGWYIVDAGEDKLVSITLFDRFQTVLEANEKSEAYRKENDEMFKLLPNAPEIVAGEVMRWAVPEPQG